MADEPAPITEHLGELRMRLGIVVVTWVVCAVTSFVYAEQIFNFLLQPVRDVLGPDRPLQSLEVQEIFITYIKASLLAGFIIDLPIIFWQVWSFVAPGLYANEKKFVIPFVTCSTLLFAGGAFFGYTQVFPLVFTFFDSFSNELVQAAWTMKSAFSVTTKLFLAFGIAFELPLFVFFLSLSGILSAGQLARGTPYAVLIIFITAALLTPPDVVSQVLLAVPMIGLYLTGVGVAWVFDPTRRRAKQDAAAAKDVGPAE